MAVTLRSRNVHLREMQLAQSGIPDLVFPVDGPAGAGSSPRQDKSHGNGVRRLHDTLINPMGGGGETTGGFLF